MIQVTQGHEDGLGLELFLKSLFCLDNSLCNQILLHINQETLKNSLTELGIEFQLTNESLKVNDKLIKLKLTQGNGPQSTTSLLSALNTIGKRDVLFTLPTTKSELVFNDKMELGHTEFFREFYQNEYISMVFRRNNDICLLLTDHIELRKVSKQINEELIFKKVSLCLSEFENIKDVVFSGINPHAGENGLLGDEEKVINESILKLREVFKDISFTGPFSGDTLQFKYKQNTLLVYAHHDQALSSFKTKHGLYGLNISLGLPFVRISPDFGTGFDIKGTDKAFYGSMLEALTVAKDFHDNR